MWLDVRRITGGNQNNVSYGTRFRVAPSVPGTKVVLRLFIGDPDAFNTIDFENRAGGA